MRTSLRFIAFLSLASATTAGAQGSVSPAAPARPGPGGAPAAKMLLANTAELGLTDAQVVRLAAIARRSEARRSTLRASMDSNFNRLQSQADTAARRQMRERMRTSFEREREQSQTDLRDAIAVLNTDQQAKAWQMMSNRGIGRGMRGGAGRRGMRGDMRGGMRGDMRGEFRERREPMMRGERGLRERPRRVPFER